jgi:hypothetical protein
MRLRKGKGKKKDRLTLTETEIVQACYDFLRKKGYELANTSYLSIPKRDRVDSLGRKIRQGIEFQVDLEGVE